MVKVIMWGGLRSYTEGKSEFEFDAATIHDVITRLGEDYPALQWQLDNSVSVAVDGQIYRDSWFVPLEPDAEVFILPKLAGG
ncbi:MAG: MoaD/ThiS family protein [Geminicoccaceae bacterium]